MTRLVLAGLLGLSLLGVAACKKDEPPPAPAATAAATPPPASVPESLSTREQCKKRVATACAIPCETKATQAEKDPAKLKILKDRCMIACLEQAETACPRTH